MKPDPRRRATDAVPEGLKLRRLEHLVLLSEELNFARAAQRSCLSQSAFSRSIAALEESLGLKLIDRTSRHACLTAVGVRVVARARPLLSSTRDLRQELDLLRRGDLGDVVAGAGPFTAVALFPQALARLRSEHPRVNVRLHVDSTPALLRRLREETVDFFVSDTREIPAADDIEVQPLGVLRGALFCRAGHPLQHIDDLRLAHLASSGFASVRMPDAVRKALSRLMLAHADLGLQFVFECESALVMRELALRSDVVLLATRDTVARELDAGLLCELEVGELRALGDRSPLQAEVGAVRAKGRTLTPASEWLLREVLDIARRTLSAPASNSRDVAIARELEASA